MLENYYTKTKVILDSLGIKVKGISTKEEVINSKNFSATLKPSIKKLVVK